ncbi:MAG TPA: hypothetical protein VM120_05060 [Bryobacteraceae bacterium]|nr:hypothetical protein [Bryobacteraceae bacterium]
MTVDQPVWNFEQEPYPDRSDETDINLRAYLDRMDDRKMQEYRPQWTAEQLMEWDGNFKNDGSLMLICSEREVKAGDYSEALEDCIRYRQRIRDGRLK